MKRAFDILTRVEMEEIPIDQLKDGEEVWYSIPRLEPDHVNGPFEVLILQDGVFLKNQQGVTMAIKTFLQCQFYRKVKEL